MKKIHLYVCLVGVILVIVGLWLFYRYPSLKEGLVNTDLVNLAGIGPNGTIFLATSSLTTTPNWRDITGGIALRQLSGSMGQIVGVNASGVVYYGTPNRELADGPFTWKTIPAFNTPIQQVTFEYPKVLAVTDTGDILYTTDITVNPGVGASYKKFGGIKVKWISLSVGKAYAIGTDNNIYFSKNIFTNATEPVWVNVSGTIANKVFTQISYDNDDVAVLDNNNILYYAYENLEKTRNGDPDPIWRQLNGRYSQITLKNGMLYAIGTAGQLYFSPSQVPDVTLTTLSNTRGISSVSILYPENTSNMVGTRSPSFPGCQPDETFYVGRCYRPCPSGYNDSEGSCVPIPKTRASRSVTIPPITYRCTTGELITLTNANGPPGSTIGKCIEGCPAGTTLTYSGGNTSVSCVYPDILSEWSVNFIECPFSYRREQKIIGSAWNHRCVKPSNVIPRFHPDPQILNPQNPCTGNEDLFQTSSTSLNCVVKCASGEVTTPTTCAPPPVTRASYSANAFCASNEIFANGVCVTKCPSGSYQSGGLCVPGKEIVAPPSTIKCVSTMIGNAKKWLCDSSDDADSLTSDPSPNTAYVNLKDQICVADDDTTKMYYCQSAADAKDNTNYMATIRKNYSSTCNNVMKNYVDLSNNITSLTLIQSGMTSSRTKVVEIKTTLDNIHRQLNCSSPVSPKVSAICNQISNASSAVNNNSSNIGSILINITTPIQAALSSRDSLLASIRNFQCSL